MPEYRRFTEDGELIPVEELPSLAFAFRSIAEMVNGWEEDE